MLEKFPCRQIAEVRACTGNIPVWTLPYEEETIAFYLTPIGSALAAGMIAEVNHLTGASVFIMFGSCGSLDKEATDGKFILPTEAYRGEGLSYYFAEPQDYIKIKNGASLICSRAFRPSSSEVNPRRATSFALPLPLPFAPFS